MSSFFPSAPRRLMLSGTDCSAFSRRPVDAPEGDGAFGAEAWNLEATLDLGQSDLGVETGGKKRW